MRSARRTFAAFLAAWCIILGVVTPTSHAQYTYAIYAPTMTGASMGFSIIQPHSTTNLDTNPSFELATTGWTLSSSATIARDTTAAKRGVASLKVTPSSTDNSGAYVTYSLTAQDYTWSADFYGAIGVTYEVHYANSSGTTLATIATVVPPTVHEDKPAEEGAAAGAESTEPEVIAKGKKDEDAAEDKK